MDENGKTTQYEIRVGGLLSERLASAFPELHARIRDHDTILSGDLRDQSALHGVLGRIEALGLELLEVRRPRTKPASQAARTPSDRRSGRNANPT